MRRTARPARRAPGRGMVLMGVLVLIALLGATAANVAQAWADQRRRELEEQLLFVGQQYRQALESYYLSSPGTVKHLPVALEDLVLDRRFPQPVRHLRRTYADPLAPDTPWGVVRKGSQIMGIYSQAPGEPFRRANFERGLESFDGARSYGQWQFIFFPRAGTAAPPAVAPRPTPSEPIAADNQKP